MASRCKISVPAASIFGVTKQLVIDADVRRGLLHNALVILELDLDLVSGCSLKLHCCAKKS